MARSVDAGAAHRGRQPLPEAQAYPHRRVLEDYLEAFANIYRNFAICPAVAAGQKEPDPFIRTSPR